MTDSKKRPLTPPELWKTLDDAAADDETSPVSVMFRKKTHEESTDEELLALLDDLELQES